VLSVTADTNIYISALNFGGVPDRVLDLARAGAIRLAISDAIQVKLSVVLQLEFGLEISSVSSLCPLRRYAGG
jgi:predicted nucleic acid-binding protein